VNVAYYISGHGFGHATRSSEIIRALVALRPDARIHVRSNVPEHLFAGIERTEFHRLSESLDPGVVETADSLGVDVPATIAQVERHYRQHDALVAAECAWVRSVAAELIVADFPPLAGEVARASRLPCVGVGNFTWDWIYEAWPTMDRRFNDWIRAGYHGMRQWLRLPFHHEAGDRFAQVIDMPLVARRPRRLPADVLARLGINAADCRPRVVLAMRGRIPPAARRAAAQANRGLLFLHFDAEGTAESNEIGVALAPDLLFTDVLSVCDVAVSKFGYGIISECIAAKKRLLCPPRLDFREDEVFAGELAGQLTIEGISRDDFMAGHWTKALQRLLDQPAVSPTLRVDGAQKCAEAIVGSWGDV
jgi:hypothetical protein